MGRRSTARRRLAGAGLTTSTSESHLESGSHNNGFPPGMTVDELRWYSRRRFNDARRPDNLHLEAGSLKEVTSEYTRCFKAPPVASYSLGDLSDPKNEQKENITIRRFSSQSEDALNKYEDGKLPRKSRRHNLKLEGDMFFQTENGDEFIEYILEKRPDLLRRDTNLKLEGEFDILTENQEKFVAYGNCQRPPLMKRSTNLHLEGEHTHLPEYKEVFVEFPRTRPVVKRPRHWLNVETQGKMTSDSETLSQFVEHVLSDNRSEILRRQPTLKCEGNLTLMPEYRASFREYPIERQCLIKQNPSLKLEGDLYTMPEYREKFTLPSIKIKRVTDEEFLNCPETALNLDLPTESGLHVSTDANLGRPPTPKASPDTINRKLKSEFVSTNKNTKTPRTDTPTEERLSSRPPRMARRRTSSQSSAKRDYQNKEVTTKEPEAPAITLEEITPYETSRYQRMRQPDHLTNDTFEAQPEYRRAYMDYLIKEKLPKKPPSGVMREKRAAMPQQFPIPNTEQSVGKGGLVPYQQTRRGSTSSMMSSPRRRSASPSYRLQVTNVDEPKKGFRQRSPLGEVDLDSGIYNTSRANWIKSITGNRKTDPNHDKYNYDNKSFVVLDNYERRNVRKKSESPWWRGSHY